MNEKRERPIPGVCASTMSVRNVVCTVDHATGAVETETREEFDAKQRKAAH